MRPFLRTFPRLLALVAAAAWLAGAAAPAAGQQERFRRTPPLPDSFRELRLPEIETSVLGNGLTVAVNLRTGSPLVTLQVVIMAGEADSPRSLPHTAALTARMMGHGTPEISAGEMESRIEAMGGEFSVRTSVDDTVLTFHVLAEHVDRALDLLRPMILQAAFTESELASVRRAYYYELVEKRKNPEFVGRRHLLHLLFEGHPYRAATSAEDTVKLVAAKDVAAFYSRFYRPNNAVFVVSGGVEGPAVVRKIGQLFGSWLRRDLQRPLPPAPLPNTKERVCFIDFPTAEDFVVFAGNVVMPPTSPDYYPFLVLNQVLGGSMGSRLFMNLRESKGYAYDAFSEAEFFRSCGVYWARARVVPETIPGAVREIARELKALSTARIVPDEIEQAKSFLIGNLPLKFATPGGYSERLSRVVALGLGPTHWNRASDSLMLVNADMVLEAAARYFLSVPIVVIVGNMEWAAGALKEFELVDVYDSAGVYRATLRKGEKK